jgi:hypothetical protein
MNGIQILPNFGTQLVQNTPEYLIYFYRFLYLCLPIYPTPVLLSITLRPSIY